MIGKNHRIITYNALQNSLNSSAVKYSAYGNLDSDKAPRKSVKNVTDGYSINAQHSNNTSLADCSNFLSDANQVVIDDFKEALKADDSSKDELYNQAFYDFGRMIHSIQDFYSHTNWINENPDGVALWDESENANIDNPDNFITSHYTQVGQFFTKIWPFTRKYLDNNYESVYKEGLDSLSHYELNKDEKGTLADELFEKNEGKSGYELAAQDATEHTKQKWDDVLSQLKSSLSDEEYKELLKDIENFSSETDESDEARLEFRKNFNADMKELADD